uniref:Centrosomal protein of 44 kDa n=1 Tax=Amphilophus citrinellus TaxID=61819 RepID=A0A3Q0R8B7_AMPCI
MLSTGDVEGGLRKLEALLRVIKYPGYVDYNGLSKGDPSAFLPIVSFALTSSSPPFAEQLMAAGLELTGKTDLHFTDTLYKVLRDIFNYKPILTRQQFLQWGFSHRKISFICDIINLILQKHSQLKKVQGLLVVNFIFMYFSQMETDYSIALLPLYAMAQVYARCPLLFWYHFGQGSWQPEPPS